MHGVTVEFRPPTEQGRLYPRYVRDAGIVAIQSRVRRDWLYGVNVDNIVICDLDAQRLLANIDVQARRNVWQVMHPFPAWPPETRQADIAFSLETLDQKFFDPEVDVITDADRLRILVCWDASWKGATSIELSADCLALVDVDRLVGLFVRFAKSIRR